MSTKPRLLFVITEDWYFVSHRLDLARAARDAGFEVGIATRVASCSEQIRNAGIHLFPLRYMRRSSRNPWIELRAVNELTALYRHWLPSIVHHVAAKPVIYGGLAAQRASIPAVVNALAGLGYVFASPSMRARALRPAILAAYRAAFRHTHSRLIVQNPEDEAVVLKHRLVSPARLELIRGSGVDTRAFAPSKEPFGVVTFVLAGRMLWNKGVGEFVEAARIARKRGTKARFVLVGDSDVENPATIPQSQLGSWQEEGTIEWWGQRNDMHDVLSSSHVVCLPTYYGEGLPKVLLEAAACGRPLLASDVPGCREIAIHNETGLLVPPRDPAALADAMQALAGDAQLRRRLGECAREVVCSNFTIEHVSAQTIQIYRDLLAE
jgi:glycosyltransferase involved in cell wall biosynthesis